MTPENDHHITTKEYLHYYKYDYNQSRLNHATQNEPLSELPLTHAFLVSPKNCYFMHSIYYVLPADLLGYITPAIMLIYFQINIYRHLSINKKRFLLTSSRVKSKTTAPSGPLLLFGSKKQQAQRRRSSFGEIEKARRRMKALAELQDDKMQKRDNTRRFLPQIFQLPAYKWSSPRQSTAKRPEAIELEAIRENFQQAAFVEKNPSMPNSPLSVVEGLTISAVNDEQINPFQNQFTIPSQRKSLTASNELVKFRFQNAARSMSQQLTHTSYSISAFTKNKKVFRTLLCVTFSLFVFWVSPVYRDSEHKIISETEIYSLRPFHIFQIKRLLGYCHGQSSPIVDAYPINSTRLHTGWNI